MNDKKTLFSIMTDTAEFYRKNLYGIDKRAVAHLRYLKERGLAPKTVETFSIGASLDFYSLPTYLKEKGYLAEDMLWCGVVSKDKNGNLFDSLFKRLIFPICNEDGQVIAFSGRLLDHSDFAKYKNTKETPLFHKKDVLYNMDLAKEYRESIIIVEGYLDVISLWQSGFRNVVATMGTALTGSQSQWLKSHTDTVYISFDGDFAGQKANLKGLNILTAVGLCVKVVALPDGKDPDEIVRNNTNEYQELLNGALTLKDYKMLVCEKVISDLFSKTDLNNSYQKREYIHKVLKEIVSLDLVDCSTKYLSMLSQQTGISFSALKKDLETMKKEV